MQTLLESPLDLVQRLPCAPAAAAAAATAPQPQAALRRAASMQALGSGPGGFAGHGDGGRGLGECQRSPSLPAVLEQEEGEGLAAAHPLHSRCAAPLQSPPAAVPQPPGPPPRRCASDSALTLLDSQQRRCQQGQAGRPRPPWLALQLQALPEPRGWGAVSPATLQELACRQLCASLAAEYHKQHGGGPLPTGLAEAVEEELRWVAPTLGGWPQGWDPGNSSQAACRRHRWARCRLCCTASRCLREPPAAAHLPAREVPALLRPAACA